MSRSLTQIMTQNAIIKYEMACHFQNVRALGMMGGKNETEPSY